jgi:hypothetical protein
MHILFLKGMIVFSLFIFLKKTKETSNSKVKILYLEDQINIYTVVQET